MKDLDVMIEELQRLVQYYTDEALKEVGEMKYYYLGKVDAFSHSLMMTQMARNSIQKEEEDNIIKMAREWFEKL